MGVVAAEETASLPGESVGGGSGILECTQAHPLGESAPGQQLEGRQSLARSGGSD